MRQKNIFNYYMEEEINSHKSAVRYYINNDVSLDDVCEIFECSRSSFLL